MTVTAWLCAMAGVWLLCPRRSHPRLREPGSMVPAGLTEWLVRLPWQLGLAAGAVGYLIVGSGYRAVAAGVMIGVGAIVLASHLAEADERRRVRHLRGQLPECLTLMAAALAAGLPISAAARHLSTIMPAPSAQVLGRVTARLDLGYDEALAWQVLTTDPVWGPVARDLSRAASSGAGVVGLVEAHAREAGDDDRGRRLADARSMGVRAVLPLVGCFLPAFLLVGVVPIVASLLGSYL